MVGQEGLASLPLRAGPHLIAPLPFWVLGVHRLWVPLVAEFSIQTPPELGSSSGPYGLALTPRVLYRWTRSHLLFLPPLARGSTQTDLGTIWTSLNNGGGWRGPGAHMDQGPCLD